MLLIDCQCIYIFPQKCTLTGICKIPCESRVDFGNARFTGVNSKYVIATRGLSVVTLISGPRRDNERV